VAVRSVETAGDEVRLVTTAGDLRARIVIGADGSASRVGHYVGVRLHEVDVGLEVELPVSGTRLRDWQHRLLIDWGPVPGSYGWVFPKGDTLTVGVIMSRAQGTLAKQYLRDFVAVNGLDDIEPLRSGGHLTRCREDGSPVRHDNVIVCGDAAGLLEPWTREGISFALRSGTMAGRAAAEATSAALARYAQDIDMSLGREMRAGRRFLHAFESHPAVFHGAISAVPHAWGAFGEITAGRRTLADYVDSSLGGGVISLLGRRRS
jgi:flavin-dependent dehydrogenase